MAGQDLLLQLVRDRESSKFAALEQVGDVEQAQYEPTKDQVHEI